MATKVVELITCDKCGADASQDHVDVTVAWRGVEYKLDLCDTHYTELNEKVAPLLKLGERSDVRRLRLGRMKKLYGKAVK